MIELNTTNEIISIDITNQDSPVISITNTPIEIEISNDTLTYITHGRIEQSIAYSDFSGGSKSIGTIPADKRIHKVSVLVTTAFDAGTMVVGDASAHGRLMVAADNNLLVENTYHNEPDYKYTTETEIKAWFETGSPTQGAATIIIYYS